MLESTYAATDIRQIAERADGPNGLAALVTFASASMRIPFSRVTTELRALRDTGRYVSPLPNKLATLRYLRSNREALWARVQSARTAHGVGGVMDELLSVPGLGIAKAGFVAQMLGHNVGCLDSQNARLFSVPANALRIGKTATARTRLANIRAYVALCVELGGSYFLWETWCEYIGAKYPSEYGNGPAVSSVHIRAVDCARDYWGARP